MEEKEERGLRAKAMQHDKHGGALAKFHPPEAQGIPIGFTQVNNGRYSKPYTGQLQFGSWNVEGLTDVKLEQICNIMQSRALGLMCLQETRVPFSGSRQLDNGYGLITAGQDDEKRTYAGVGFLIAPWLRRSVYSFKPISERLCCIKLRVRRGKAAIFNVYAPHGGYEYGVRQQFFPVSQVMLLIQVFMG